MDDELKQNLTASETWLRGLFILLFAFLLVVARIVTGAVVVIQFLFTVFAGQTNENLRNFGSSLAQFIYQTLLFVTYNSDTKPFPFATWPEPIEHAADVQASAEEAVTEVAEIEEDNTADNDEPDEHEPRT